MDLFYIKKCNLLSKHLQFSFDLINYETFYIPSSSVFSVSPFIEETISPLENTRLAIYLDNKSQELLCWTKMYFWSVKDLVAPSEDNYLVEMIWLVKQ